MGWIGLRGQMSGWLLSAHPGDFKRGQPAEADESEQGDDCLGDDAIETPNLEDVLFNMSEIKGESKTEECGKKEQTAPPKQGQQRQQQIACDADGGDWDVVNFGEGTVVDDAAVPPFVN